MIKDRRFLKEKTPEAAPQPAAVRLPDVINVDGLHGELADPQPSLPHDIISGHTGFPGGTSDFLRADGLFAPPPSPPAVFNPSGTGFRHVTAGSEDAAAKLVEDADVDPAAAILESKLSLNFPTHSNALDHSNILDHSNANDPTAGEKAALPGTNGVVGVGNKYVTDSDPRNSDSRTPLAHKASHEDGGSDEISVLGLSGLLADPQTPILTGLGGRGLVLSGSILHFAQNSDYTPGAIPFATSTTAIGFDSTNLFWDNALKLLKVASLEVNGLSTFNVPFGTSVIFNNTQGSSGAANLMLNRNGVNQGALRWDANLISLRSNVHLTFATEAGAGEIFFNTNNTGRWKVDTTGALEVLADNAYDIGTSIFRPRTLYLGTSLFTPALTVSGMTAGSVLFAGAGGLVSQDNTNLFWDNALNKLQVANMEVNGVISSNFPSPVGGIFDSASGGSSFEFFELGVRRGGISWDATQISLASDVDLLLLTASTERVRVDSSGKVGIGATPLANTILDVMANANAVNQQLFLRNSGTYHTGLIASSTATPLADDSAWGLFGGPGSYLTGTAEAIALMGGLNVPSMAFRFTSSNLNVAGGFDAFKVLRTGAFTHNMPAGAGGILNCTAASDCRLDFQMQTVRSGLLSWDTANIQLASDGVLWLNPATDLVLYSESTARWTLSSGHLVPNADNAYNIGSFAVRPQVIYAKTRIETPQVRFPPTHVPDSDPNTYDGYEEGFWTPIDSSGAGLSFTVVAADCRFIKSAGLIVANFRLVFPATASGLSVAIGGLPFTSIGSDGMGGFPTYQPSGANMMFAMAANGTYFVVFKNDGNQFANSALSGMDIRGTIIYFCT